MPETPETLRELVEASKALRIAFGGWEWPENAPETRAYRRWHLAVGRVLAKRRKEAGNA